LRSVPVSSLILVQFWPSDICALLDFFIVSKLPFFSQVLSMCAEEFYFPWRASHVCGISFPWCSSCVQNLPSKCFCLNLFQCLSLNLVQPALICVGRQECDPGSYSSWKSSSSAKPFSWASAANSSSSSWSSKPVRIARLRLAVELLVHSTRQRAPP